MASSRIAEAYVQLVPSATGFKNAIAQEIDAPIANSVNQAGTQFAGLGKIVMGAFAAGTVIAFTKELIGAAQAEIQQNARINQISTSMGLFGDQAGEVSQRLIDLAQTQALGIGLDEDTIKNTQAKLLTFKNLAETAGDMGGMFDRATMAAMDLAAAGFGSAEGNAVALGKALNDPIAGMASLGRMGVQFTDEQKAMIESMVKAGDMAGAQALIMGELETQVGGTATATATAGDRMTQAWENFKETIGLSILPAFSGFASAMADGLKWMADNMNIVIPIFAGLAAVILTALAPAIWAAVTATWAFTVALLANPLTWIALAVGALIAGLVLLVMNWQVVVDFLVGVFQPVIDAVGAAFTWLWESIIKPVVDAVAAVFTWLWDYILFPIFKLVMLYIGLWAALFTWLYETIVKPVFEAIGTAFTWLYENVIKPVIGFISDVIHNLGAVFNWLFTNVVKPVFDGLGAAFKWVWENVIKPVVGFITGAIESIGSVVSNVFGAIGGFIRSVFEGIVGIIRGPVNAVIGFVNTLIDGLNGLSVKIPDWIPEWGGKTIGFNLSHIPMLADGGTLTSGGTVLVGERGPELLNLPGGASVVPLNNGAGLSVNYYAAPNESIDSEQQLFTAMRRAKVVAGW